LSHIDLDLVFLVLDGQLPPSVLLRAAYEHLKELCPECSETLGFVRQAEPRLFRDPAAASPDTPALERFEPRYAAAFDAAAERARERARLVEEERKRARQDLRKLLELAPEEREPKIVNARSRYRSRALAELLLEESRQLTRLDPAEAGNLAALARTVVLWTPGALNHTWSEVIQARSMALRANAARVAGDLREADALFITVRRFLAKQALGDCELHAETCSLEASLRLDQRRFDDAENLLDRAVLLYRQAGNREGLAKSLVKRGALQQKTERYAESIESHRESLDFLKPDGDVHLYLCAVSNLSLCLCEVEQYAEARRVVRANQRHYASYDDEWTRLRHRWLLGRIALGLEEWDDAEAVLAEARNGFICAGNGFNAALVSLDLAMLYLHRGRTAELKRLAGLMAPIFDAQDVHREAVAALLLFQNAVAAEQITAESILRLRTYLHRAQSDPKLKYEKAS